mmetsp:Transcript_16885/g.29569  ORF Transcript_16885/g.29569 Transcript_16885/m.29569 type:complete len:205 (-) Transcript_16885:136-750(-)
MYTKKEQVIIVPKMENNNHWCWLIFVIPVNIEIDDLGRSRFLGPRCTLFVIAVAKQIIITNIIIIIFFFFFARSLVFISATETLIQILLEQIFFIITFFLPWFRLAHCLAFPCVLFFIAAAIQRSILLLLRLLPTSIAVPVPIPIPFRTGLDLVIFTPAPASYPLPFCFRFPFLGYQINFATVHFTIRLENPVAPLCVQINSPL